jgi:large subunit ribosomal protein L5
MSFLREHYNNVVRSELMQVFKYKSIMQVPRIEKVVINVGLGEAVSNPKLIENVLNELAIITGQRGIITRARKAISNFKIRKGMPIGVKVTLRRDRMYYFLERLIHIALPRVKDFKGLNPNSFDKFGNYTFGVREQIIFPEINYDKIEIIYGMDITIVTTARTKEEAYALLSALGFPFRKK